MALYFVRADGSDQIYVARQDSNMLYRDTFSKEKAKLEIVEQVPPETVTAAVKGTKILNMAKALGFKQHQR